MRRGKKKLVVLTDIQILIAIGTAVVAKLDPTEVISVLRDARGIPAHDTRQRVSVACSNERMPNERGGRGIHAPPHAHSLARMPNGGTSWILDMGSDDNGVGCLGKGEDAEHDNGEEGHDIEV